MIIDAIAHEKNIKARIVARDTDKFNEAFNLITSIPEEDRYYDKVERMWIIHNPEKYVHLDFIRNALDAKKMQLNLFDKNQNP